MDKPLYTCPWCGSHTAPGLTRHHADKAEFVYSPKSEEAIRLNPRICLECYGVGGSEDFCEAA